MSKILGDIEAIKNPQSALSDDDYFARFAAIVTGSIGFANA